MTSLGRPWAGESDPEIVRQMILDEEPSVSLHEMALAGQRRGPWPRDLDPTPYNELRRVVELVYLRGGSLRVLAEMLGLSRSNVYSWVKGQYGTSSTRKSNVPI